MCPLELTHSGIAVFSSGGTTTSSVLIVGANSASAFVIWMRLSIMRDFGLRQRWATAFARNRVSGWLELFVAAIVIRLTKLVNACNSINVCQSDIFGADTFSSRRAVLCAFVPSSCIACWMASFSISHGGFRLAARRVHQETLGSESVRHPWLRGVGGP